MTPTKNGNRYRFAWADVVFEIDAMVGARVGTLSLGGANLIMTSATDPTTWGSVFWTSPRSAWTPVLWPPPPMIDNAPYTTGGISGTHVVLSGPTDTSIGVSMGKDYSADATSGWMKIAYTINATKAQRAAPWEVSRVPRGGIVFFPVPSSSAVVAGPLTITQSGGIVWFNDAPMTATSPAGDKLYADGSGWTAYVVGGNLFLKRFTDQPASLQPAMEGEIDVYPGAGFLEFEVQGPYTQIAANGSLPWSIEWRVVKVPTSVSIAVGSAGAGRLRPAAARDPLVAVRPCKEASPPDAPRPGNLFFFFGPAVSMRRPCEDSSPFLSWWWRSRSAAAVSTGRPRRA